jgi:GLPGLI family protein
MKRTKLLLIAMSVWAYGYAQETHVIEPAILEVRYDSWQEEHDDSYILRVGKTANQFFSYFRYRTDSLMFTNDETSKIALQELLDSNDRSPDRSKRLKASTIGREWLYQDLTVGKMTLYSDYASAYNTYEEDIPKQEWQIYEDSVLTILGMECHKATTTFRGRVWEVWFTEELPISLGPWKLGGLPGLILKATADKDFIKFTAISIKSDHLNPVTYYNWGNEKYYKMDRAKFLRYKNRPRSIPYADKVLPPKPYIELE